MISSKHVFHVEIERGLFHLQVDRFLLFCVWNARGWDGWNPLGVCLETMRRRKMSGKSRGRHLFVSLCSRSSGVVLGMNTTTKKCARIGPFPKRLADHIGASVISRSRTKNVLRKECARPRFTLNFSSIITIDCARLFAAQGRISRTARRTLFARLVRGVGHASRIGETNRKKRGFPRKCAPGWLPNGSI